MDDATATLIAGAAAAVTTLIAGGAAIAAAYWTLRDTRRSALVNSLERKLDITNRTLAVLEVTIGGVAAVINTPEKHSATIPWNAFSALSGDIGALDIDQIRIFVFIESLARDFEKLAYLGPKSTRRKSILDAMTSSSEELKEICEASALRLKSQLEYYYHHPWRGRLPRRYQQAVAKSMPTRQS